MLIKLHMKKNNINSSNYPYNSSRLININNEAFVIGGKRNNNINNLGANLCIKISYINNNKYGGLGEIKCKFMKNTNFEHHSHSALYSKLYNIIFVLSGYNQDRCEYGKLNNKGEIDKWEEMPPLEKPREESINFILNERFIYLLGGVKVRDNIDDSYDVFDITTIFGNALPKWKQISVKTDQYSKYLFETVGSGIVELSNKIYILGGYIYEKEEFMVWKISFNEGFISNIENIKTNHTFKKKKHLSFLGQQLFMQYEDNYFNINLCGECEIFHRTFFNK